MISSNHRHHHHHQRLSFADRMTFTQFFNLPRELLPWHVSICIVVPLKTFWNLSEGFRTCARHECTALSQRLIWIKVCRRETHSSELLLQEIYSYIVGCALAVGAIGMCGGSSVRHSKGSNINFHCLQEKWFRNGLFLYTSFNINVHFALAVLKQFHFCDVSAVCALAECLKLGGWNVFRAVVNIRIQKYWTKNCVKLFACNLQIESNKARRISDVTFLKSICSGW